MAGRIRIGVSGWRYPPWRGNFYPAGLAQARELQFAARAFNSIELNGSFYSLQRPSSYACWARETPPGFVFAVKGGRYITHMLKLRNARTALANFLASGLLELRDKLGPILWQFPPRMKFNPEVFEEFFHLLPRTATQAALLAREHDRRLQGRVALEAALEQPLRHAANGRQPRDARLISGEPPLSRASRDVYCYFDNTDKLHAPDNARELMQRLGVRWHPAG